ncbi:MAG TPA: HAD family hydrolase [Steroidobacteraceae bacterium]|nr:HAD family hydrolase [Steroidobacteraceae bacterium]
MVILFDVDNTLLDNDAVTADLSVHLGRAAGTDEAAEYFRMLETLRAELGYADYLGALQRYRAAHPHDFQLLRTSQFLVDYPFGDRLYPGALEMLAQASTRGTTAILSDGDVVFQPIKVARAGLWDAVRGRVLIYVHKEQELADVAQRLPSAHYVVVDDKRPLLAAIKSKWGARVTTVWVKQGHYATAPDVERHAMADLVLDSIGEFSRLGTADLLEAGRVSIEGPRP